jgi:hypothetical protein
MIAAEGQPYRFVITIMPSGEMRIEGIKPDKIWMYGLLKGAEKALDEYFSNMDSRIQRPTHKEVKLVQ